MVGLLTGFAGKRFEGAFCLIALSETRPGVLKDRSHTRDLETPGVPRRRQLQQIGTPVLFPASRRIVILH
jgi:hypothetical protein